MKVTLILCTFCALACIEYVHCKPRTNQERFQMTILEKGSEYQQDVELDEAAHLVSVHVPAHNNVQETYFMTDTKEHFTVRLAPDQRVCFLMRNDPDELPSADVWRKNKDRYMDDDESTVERRSYMVSGALSLSEQSRIPKSIREACVGLSLVWIEPIQDEGPASGAYTNHTSAEDRLQKRYVEFCVDKAQKCTVFHNSCYHVMTCMNAGDAICIKKRHIYEDVRCCCDCCLDSVVPDWSFTPDCNKKFTKEEICPNFDFV